MKTLILVVLSTLLAGAAHAHPDHAETGMQREAAGMAEAAADFLATLDEDQRARLLFDLDDTEAREAWSNLPTSMAPRSGLQIATLSDAQRIALHGLLARAMSSEGYGEAMHIMTLEPYLRAGVEAAIAERGDEMPEDMLARATAIMESYDPENYWVRIFGDPASGTWSLVLDGHHLAVTATVVDGRIAFTPVFLGNNPQIIQTGLYAGRRSLQHELDRVADLMASLDADQMGQLVQSEDTQDSADFAGPGWVPDMDAAPEGLSATDLNPDQLVLLSYAIREFIGVATLAAGDAQMARIEADGMETIRLAWWGDYTDLSRRFMLRITGPSLHIDFTRTGGEDRPNHFHIIVRDPSNEYGSDWLQSHYEEAHADE